MRSMIIVTTGKFLWFLQMKKITTYTTLSFRSSNTSMTYILQDEGDGRVDSHELGYNVAVLVVEMSIPIYTKHQWSLLFSSIARLFDGMHTGCQYRLLWLTVPTWTLYHCAYWRCIKTRLYICYHNGIRKRSLHYIAILWLSNPITSNPLPCLNLRALWSIERISGIWSRDAILICSLTGYGWHQSNIYFFL